MGVRGILVYCADYQCLHSIAISGDAWPDDVRLSDIEARGLSVNQLRLLLAAFACGKREDARAADLAAITHHPDWLLVPVEIQPHVDAALAGSLAHKQIFDVGQADVIGPWSPLRLRP